MLTQDCLVKTAAIKTPDKIVIETPDFNLTYAELDAKISKKESQFNSSVSGEILPIFHTNPLDQIITFFAGLRRSQILLPLDPTLSEEAKKSFLKTIPKIIPKKTGGPATIFQTSSSTGTPKKVVHSINNHIASAKAAIEDQTITSNAKTLLTLPLFHVGGFATIIRTILSNSTLCIPKSQQHLSEAINMTSPTHISLVPTQLKRLLENTSINWSSITCILLGGAPCPETIFQKAQEKKLPIFPTYGLTETASQIASPKPLPHMKIKFSNQGEILTKGQSLFLGYLVKSLIHLPLDKEGWFNTKDLGKYDASGSLTIIGRKDRLIISGGENIHPEEIEKELTAIHSIESAKVTSEPCEEFGQKVIAYIHPLKNIDDIKQQLKNKLPRYKIPKEFRLLETKLNWKS